MLAKETDGKTTGRQRDEEMCVWHVNITETDRGINIVYIMQTLNLPIIPPPFFMHN